MSPEPITWTAEPGRPSAIAIARRRASVSSMKRSLPGDELELVEQVLHVDQPDDVIDVARRTAASG